MASGRFLSVSVAEDDRLNNLSMVAELIYLKTVPHLDRDGMITGKPRLLHSKVCPLREELYNKMQKAIDEWVIAGLVIRMETSEGPVLFFPGFLKNNKLAHYDRERPSRFQPPPGYYRTDDGLLPEGIEPPKKKAKIPPPSNENPSKVQESIQDKVQDFSLQEQEEDQDQVKEEGKGARMAESPPPPADPPPSYRRTIEPGEYIPGVRRPQQNQAKRNADTFTGQASKFSVGPEPFRLMVDSVLDATGKTSLANTNGDLGQQTLNAAKQTVVDLLEMGRRAVEDVEVVLASWRENDWRGASPPSFKQVVEHASAMDAGTHITAKRQEMGKKDFSSFQDYNEWAARNDPDYKRIREGVLIKGMLVKRDSYQPAKVH